ncbi:MAG: hypothetical protein IKG44_06115 [Mogibacterium sp.]|nr:hypothetical protein [Mogibacterium sp.]
MTILLAIKPEFVKKIFSGEKKYEFRKRLAAKDIDKIIMYETSPASCIVGEVDVIRKLSNTKDRLWKETKDFAGINRVKYNEYFSDCIIACAYEIGCPVEYEKKITINHLGIQQIPQSFIYLTKEQYDICASNI